VSQRGRRRSQQYRDAYNETDFVHSHMLCHTRGGLLGKTRGNQRRARLFVADGHIYRVELTGWRFPLVHDPLSLLLDRTRKATLTIELPRIEGVIDGGEIPVGPDKLRYVGRVVVTNRKMQVDLYYDDRRPLSWNDEYTLVPRHGTR
jgi:hypothetical protein